ncbi:MAG: hypothetical protein M1819_005302 [Sarea resinae]|nr:MAG: hypothetical protein M1819_005302 [Sarea resinae]
MAQATSSQIQPYTGDKKALKPLVLYSHSLGPNPWKVAIILTELGLPYEPIYQQMKTMKEPAYESINPNGRVPSLHDPNTGLTLWESGAIIMYLLSTYDPTYQLHAPPTSPDHWYQQQFLHFQVSGQGPYYGQCMWFSRYHPEKIPSAIERYRNEIRRVVGVLNRALTDAGGEWLVGGKCSYADLVFLMWDHRLEFNLTANGGEEAEKAESEKLKAAYPVWYAWRQRMRERSSVSKVLAEQLKVLEESPGI